MCHQFITLTQEQIDQSTSEFKEVQLNGIWLKRGIKAAFDVQVDSEIKRAEFQVEFYKERDGIPQSIQLVEFEESCRVYGILSHIRTDMSLAEIAQRNIEETMREALIAYLSDKAILRISHRDNEVKLVIEFDDKSCTTLIPEILMDEVLEFEDEVGERFSLFEAINGGV